MDSTAPSTDTAEQTTAVVAPPPTLAPVAPTPPTTPHAPRILLILLIVAIIGLGGSIGYFIGTRNNKVNTVTDPGAQTETKGNESSQSGVLYGPQYPIPTPSPCLPGFTYYENDYFSLCYPKSMDFDEKDVNTDKEVGIEVDFFDDVEQLIVKSNYVGNLDQYNCANNKIVTVSGYRATRYTIQEESKPGTCSKNIIKYATLIGMNKSDNVYYLGLSKTDGGTYVSGSLKFQFIEQSFQVKK